MTKIHQDRILVLHDDPDSYFKELKTTFPQLPIELCRTTDSVMNTVETLQPTIIYSWKSANITHDIQRRAIMASSVKWVQIGGAGFDHLTPLPEATAVFTNMSGVLADNMAETVLGALLMLNFRFPKAMQQQRQRLWKPYTFPSVKGKTAVIVGLGQIGQKVAQRCQQFGMTVIGIRNNQTPLANVDQLLPPNKLREVLPQADYLCLHVPYTSQTHHMIDAEAFDLLPNHALLINTARGGVVDEDALLNALNTESIAGAYSDVFEQEPLPAKSLLWDAPNHIISPHIADTIDGWEIAYTQFFYKNIRQWLAGKPLLNLVDIHRGY
ncbi:MAG: D-2-hydroxyacid dehydrogenase [Chloroflexota bacterium]